MNIELVTKEDLQAFRMQLLADLAALFAKPEVRKEWLRSSEVRKKLKISAGTLQNLRIAGTLKPTKIGGMFFYRASDLEKLLEAK